ncbi:MAG TPA: DUF3540 domain-containing protein [Gammaproteobacteria bacterium]|nr:DUF3540 domain-containing protein [Gammaproteobacteria bacterium]
MSQVAHIKREPAAEKYFGPGEILSADEAAGTARVKFMRGGEPRSAWARIAVPGKVPLAPGDEVLIGGECAEALFVVALLTNRTQSCANEIRTADGALARLEGEGSAQRLRVYSQRDELLFEYDSTAGTGRLSMARGDLEIETREGDIHFKAARNVRFEGQEIELAARGAIRLHVLDALRQSTSSLSLGLHRLRAAAGQLTLDAGRAHMSVEDARYIGKRLVGKIVHLQLVADKCETVTRVLIEKTRNAYRTVEQLSQLKAGRMRALIEETYQMSSGRAFLKSRHDFKVKADKIHLG